MNIKIRYRTKEKVPYLLLTGVTGVLLYRCFFSFVWSDESFYLSLVHRFWVGDRPVIDEWSGVQFYAVALLPLYSIYRRVVGSSDGVYLFFRILMVLANYILSIYILKSLRKRTSVWPAFFGALLYLLYTRANILGASYYSFALLFFTWSLFLLLNNQTEHKRRRMFLSGCAIALAVLAIPYLAILYILIVCIILVIPCLRKYQKRSLWMVFGTFLCAAIFCAFLLTKADLGEIIENIPHFLSDTEHENGNVLVSIMLWFARIVYRYKYTFPGMIFCLIYIFFRMRKSGRLNSQTDILYIVINLIICAINIILSGDMIGCANIAISILAASLYLLRTSYSNIFWKDYIYLVYIPGIFFSMIFHYASNTGLDSMTVGFAVCSTISPLIIWESLKYFPIKKKAVKKGIYTMAFALLGIVTLQTGRLRLFGVYRDDSLDKLQVQLVDGPAKYLYTTEEHANQYMNLVETIQKTCQIEKVENVVFVEMAPWAYLCLDVSCGAPSPCRFWGGLSDENLKKYYEQMPESFPDYVCDIAPEYGNFRSVYIQGGEYSDAPNGTNVGKWLIETVQAKGYEAQKSLSGVVYKKQ